MYIEDVRLGGLYICRRLGAVFHAEERVSSINMIYGTPVWESSLGGHDPEVGGGWTKDGRKGYPAGESEPFDYVKAAMLVREAHDLLEAMTPG